MIGVLIQSSQIYMCYETAHLQRKFGYYCFQGDGGMTFSPGTTALNGLNLIFCFWIARILLLDSGGTFLGKETHALAGRSMQTAWQLLSAQASEIVSFAQCVRFAHVLTLLGTFG